MVTRIKVCGHTSPQDAVNSARLGADAVGFIHGFPRSPRNVDRATAEMIYRSVPVFCETVPVTNMSAYSDIFRLKPRVVQFVGEPSQARALQADHPDSVIMPVVQMGAHPLTAEEVGLFADFKFVVVDTASDTGGGSGKPHDWNRTRALSKEWGNIVLAGGLGPHNVREAIRTVEPYGVDASSKLESRPGVKDHSKVKKFIEEARSAG
ncbi:MAG: phosphoribosylanthranilate isomerase [Thermoprotei archaeon]